MIEPETAHTDQVQWAKVIDHTRCIGCHACTTACKSENVVPVGVTRTYVKHVDVGVWPQVRRAHQVTRCNQCAHAPCVTACPTAAMFKRADGIVDFDKSICIGCKACMAACPYDAIFINPEDHSAEKCNFCAHRIDVGLEPACVVVCPTQAILIGDMNDQSSYVAQIVNREAVNVRRPEKETLPKLFYKGAHQATLDPLAARRPEAGLFMWSEQQQSPDHVVSGNPTYNNSSAAALVELRRCAFNPMGLAREPVHVDEGNCEWGLFGGGVDGALWIFCNLTMCFGYGSRRSSRGAFLGITGLLLLWDLEHPDALLHDFYAAAMAQLAGERRVYYCRLFGGSGAAFRCAAFCELARGCQMVVDNSGRNSAVIMTAIYTAYLFAQAKARDLWQNPLLPPHLLIQAILLGSAVLLLAALLGRYETTPGLAVIDPWSGLPQSCFGLWRSQLCCIS